MCPDDRLAVSIFCFANGTICKSKERNVFLFFRHRRQRAMAGANQRFRGVRKIVRGLFPPDPTAGSWPE